MLRGLAKRFAMKCGYEILRYPRLSEAHRSLAGLLQKEQINLVLDVGANVGQFVADLRAVGYGGRIVSFEPLSSAHAELCMLAEGDPNWTIADRTAIGSETGAVDIHISGNSMSSSILEMLSSHSDAAPESSYVSVESVSVRRLDDLCTLAPTDRVLVKIDVQGFERQVVEGARRVLANSRAVISEISLVPLYEGQILAKDMWDLLAVQGFVPWSLEPCFRHPETGRLLQLDGVFVRSNDEL
jgi:FkbM family methyltransferase